MFDPEKFGQAMAEAIRAAVEPLKAQIADLTRQLAALPTVPTLGEIEGMVKDEVQNWTMGIPVPKDGAPGADGKSVTVADVLPTLQAEIQRAVAALPAPAQGPAGPAGAPGADGKSVTAAEVAPLLADDLFAEVKKLVERHKPKDGADGAPGRDGERGMDGAPGRDGVGVAGAMIDRDGALLVTLADGSVKNLGPVVGRDGKDGTDGIGLDDFALEYLPESHEVMVRAAVGTRVKELRYPAGGIRPGGYWRDGVKAKAGEAWVHDGSTFYAKRDTDSKPEAAAADWMIGARKGRDGDDRKRAAPAPAGPIKLGV